MADTPPRVDGDADEEPLLGGNVGGAVRVGATVRRPTGPWTPTVHALLDHLAARGLDGVPRALGTDAQGREVLTFLDGDVPDLEAVTTGQLASAAGWLARYHRAVGDFRPSAPVWRLTDRALAPDEIVCHHDAAVYNMAFDGDRLVGVFDWDTAGPGVPLDELAFLAWSGVPFYRVVDPDVAADRLTAIADAYARESARRSGASSTSAARATDATPSERGDSPAPSARAILDHVVVRLGAGCDRIEAGARAGDPGMLALGRVGEPARTRAQLRDFVASLPRYRSALGSSPP